MTAATHRPEDPAAVHSAALSAFLAGPARDIAAVESLPAQPAYAPAHTRGGPSDGSLASEDPENIRRRRWGAGATVPSSSPAPPTPSPSEVSWWQKTSWFKDGAADVAPVLADPSGADHGRGGIADASAASDGTCRNRFTGPGQRDPLRPATARSVSLHANAPVEDPGEVYGGANAHARASGGGVYVPVGGAMVHSRLSIQPRARPKALCFTSQTNAEPRRCADAFEAALRGGAPAPERVACAVASAAARVKYDFDFAKGVWAVRDTGAVVRARETRETDARREGERTDAAAESATDGGKKTRPELPVQNSKVTEAKMSPETSARAEETRGARLRCFAAGHDAALAAAAAKRRAREARVAAATLKRAAAQVPLPPLGATDRCRFARRAEEQVLGDAEKENAEKNAVETDAARWRALRLRETGDVVFFDAPDACDALVQAWLSGETPCPEIRVLELSREARAAAGVPRGGARAGGPGGARRRGGGGAPSRRRGGRRGEAHLLGGRVRLGVFLRGSLVARRPAPSRLDGDPPAGEHHRAAGGGDGRERRGARGGGGGWANRKRKRKRRLRFRPRRREPKGVAAGEHQGEARVQGSRDRRGGASRRAGSCARRRGDRGAVLKSIIVILVYLSYVPEGTT